MSEQRKTRSSVAAPERAEETGSASRADTTSQNYCTSDQGRTQAGYISQFLLAGAGQGLHLRDLVRITQLSERGKKADPHRATEAYPDPQQQPRRILPPI